MHKIIAAFHKTSGKAALGTSLYNGPNGGWRGTQEVRQVESSMHEEARKSRLIFQSWYVFLILVLNLLLQEAFPY